MKIVHHQQFLRTNFIHRDQVPDRFLKCAQRLVMSQIADVLTDECLAVDDQRDCIFQVGADCQNRTLARDCRDRHPEHILEPDEE